MGQNFIACDREQELLIAIGDVVGHGPRAAAAMGQIRSALTATASAADGPGQLLGRLHEFAGRTPDVQFSTVCVAFLDSRDGDLRYASAGHLPPALVGPDGSAGLLEGGRSYPLWAVGPDGDDGQARQEGRATVPAGGGSCSTPTASSSGVTHRSTTASPVC